MSADDTRMGSESRQEHPGGDAVRPRAVAVYGSFRYGPYFEDILAGVMTTATAADVPVISVQTSAGVLPSGDETSGQSAVSRVAWDHFDAAITLLQAVSPEYIAELRAAGKFVVQIGQDLRGADAAIAIDNVGGVRDAVSHLAEHGHSRIGFLSPGWQVDSAERYDAYVSRLEELGLPVLPMLGGQLSRDLTFDHQGYRAARELVADPGFLAGSSPCTALVVAPDLVALGFMRGLREAGVRIPDDLAVIGIDDVDEAAVSEPPLATVAVSFERVGATACSVALQGVRGPVGTRHLVPERLIPRESCGCPSAAGTTQGGHSSPVVSLASALLDVAGERELRDGACTKDLTGLAERVVALLDGSEAGSRPGHRTVSALAQEINRHCPIDRSVQSVLGAIRAVSHTLTDASARAGDAQRTGAIGAVTVDLCDAVRSGQLQRRMSEHVGLKRLQTSHYFIGNSLLGRNRDELRSLAWLQHTPVRAGALGLWDPPGQTEWLKVQGLYTPGGPTAPNAELRPIVPTPSITGAAPGRAPSARATEVVDLQAFPPRAVLGAVGGRSALTVITQVRFEDSDWGILAVAGDRILQSALVQETFHQWSIMMSTSLDQEKADADLARQADELAAAYRTEAALLEEVRISEERYVLATEAARGAVWDWDLASGRVFYSSSWKALLGHHDNEIGSTADEWLDRIHPDDLPGVRDQLDRTQQGAEQQLDFEHRLLTSTGEYRWIACSGRPVADESGRPVRLVGSITDVTARRLLQEQLVQDALYDELTGLARTALFKDRIRQALEAAKRRPGQRFALLFIDLNDFKAINDSFGHAAGDDLLASVAGRLRECLRADDIAARLGGDEFGVLLNDVAHQGELDSIVERIQARITSAYEVRGQLMSVGAAIGVALGHGDVTDADALLHEADAAMYRVKHRARVPRIGPLAELPHGSLDSWSSEASGRRR
jgi:diguanylate cyclase (GGDEF)-like protein/PAS domain S-box-containing protein